MSFATKIVSMRKGPFNSALAFFDVAIGDVTDGEFVGVFQVKGFALKAKRDGGFFYQAPSKQRIKGGEVQKDAKGYDIWDPYFDLFTDSIEGKIQPTPAAWDGRKALLEQAVAAYEASDTNNAGRGAAKAPAKAPAKAAAKAKAPAKIESESEDVFPEALDEEDDDLPF
jgi:hypothetical protein